MSGRDPDKVPNLLLKHNLSGDDTMFRSPPTGARRSHPWLPFSSPWGTVITAAMPLATFYRNENVRTADYGGRWKNQFSFRRETFVFALGRPAEI